MTTTAENSGTRQSGYPSPGSSNDFERLAEIARQLGVQSLELEAHELGDRLRQGRFYVACIGQFKRGKSTLINALVGREILPTGFTPVTAVPTVVRYGDSVAGRVKIQDQGWTDILVRDLEHYVSEQHNPENRKRVVGAEVFVPCPLLRAGMCFVDTPGLGSVFSENTAATKAFIPHIDAALVVIGADPPLAGEELSMVEAVSENVTDLIVVMNKSDRTTDGERAAATAFTRNVLEQRLRTPVPHIYEVSAITRKNPPNSARDWDALVNKLEELVQDSGRTIIADAGQRGRARLSQLLLLALSEQKDALMRPVQQSEQRIAMMRETVAAAEQSMRDLGYLLMAEQRRISDFFLSRRKAFIDSELPVAQSALDSALRSAPVRFGPAYRRWIMRQGQEIARNRILPWLQLEQRVAEQEYHHLASRFTVLANEFLHRLATSGIPELDGLPGALDPEQGFRSKSRFLFRDFIERAQPASPLRWVSDAALSTFGFQAPIDNAARSFLAWLFEVNSTRVQSDIFNRVEESRHQLETDIRKLLHAITHVAEAALRSARQLHEEGQTAVEARVARLDELRQQLRV